jgi:hypothetical protein
VNATVAPAQPGCCRPDPSSACRLIQDLKDLLIQENAILEGAVDNVDTDLSIPVFLRKDIGDGFKRILFPR